jgi:hypothetical protein
LLLQLVAETYNKGNELFLGDTHLLLGAARVHDMMNELDKGVVLYKQVLQYDASNVEAVACLASNHFYSDQPEVALKYYRYEDGCHTALWLSRCCMPCHALPLPITFVDWFAGVCCKWASLPLNSGAIWVCAVSSPRSTT